MADSGLPHDRQAEARVQAIRCVSESKVLDFLYRVEKEWRVIACVASCVGAIVLWVDFLSGVDLRVSAGVLMACSVLCQVVSWRAMRGAERLEKKRLARLSGEGDLNG